MFLKIISYFSIFSIFNNLDRYSTSGAQCLSVKGKTFVRKHDQINCGKNKSIDVERAWIDRQPDCVYDKSQTNSFLKDDKKISCFSSSYCHVEYYKSNRYRGDRFLNIRFKCKDCIAIPTYTGRIITCPANSVIRIADVSYGDKNCPVNKQLRQNIEYFKDRCKDQNICQIRNNDPYAGIASIYFQCGDDKNTKDHEISTESNSSYDVPGDTNMEHHGDSSNPDDDTSTESYGDSNNLINDIRTESYGRSSIPDEDISTESPDSSNYAAIAGGIVGGVLLIICIILGVLLLRRRNCTASCKKNVMTNLNPTYNPNHGQTEPEKNQQAHLMNSTDAIHVSTSHAVGVDNAANEVSNTYSHLQNTVDDTDAMYDHTIRHNVHDTCDSDYGIAHRRITEDDYDVSGNYRQSLSKMADPVYN